MNQEPAAAAPNNLPLTVTLRAGDPDPTDPTATVGTILASNLSYVLYTSTHPRRPTMLACQTNYSGEEFSQVHPYLTRAERLASQAAKCVPKAELIIVHSQIAGAVAAGLNFPRGTLDMSVFDSAEAHINHYATSRAKIYYATGATLCASLIAAAFVATRVADAGFSERVLEAARSVLLGAIGGLTLAFSQARDPKVDVYASRTVIFFNGFSRVLLGGLFGFVCLLLIDGGLFMSAATTVPGLKTALLVIAGFSEWLVPKLLEKTGHGLVRDEEEKEKK